MWNLSWFWRDFGNCSKNQFWFDPSQNGFRSKIDTRAFWHNFGLKMNFFWIFSSLVSREDNLMPLATEFEMIVLMSQMTK